MFSPSEKARAHVAAQKAHPVVQPCEECGDTKAERHHPDYGKPTEIEWLCSSCHRLRHWAIMRETMSRPQKHDWEAALTDQERKQLAKIDAKIDALSEKNDAIRKARALIQNRASARLIYEKKKAAKKRRP
jgi:hypothetical protein